MLLGLCAEVCEEEDFFLRMGAGRVGSARMAVWKASGSAFVGMGVAEIIGSEAVGGFGGAAIASRGPAGCSSRF